MQTFCMHDLFEIRFKCYKKKSFEYLENIVRNFTYKQSFEHSIKLRRFDNIFFNVCTFQVVLNNCEVKFHKIEACVNKHNL